MIGIYKITCIPTGKFYIGSSKDIQRRWNEHKNTLQKNKHHSILLQRAWNKYGKENFSFEVLEKTKEDELLYIEQFYLDTFMPYKKTIGFNLSPRAQNNAMKGEKHPLYGKGHSEETKRKMKVPKSENARKNMSLNHADVRGKNNPMYGKTCSDKAKIRSSEANTGRLRGEKSPNAKITREIAEKAKLLYATKKYTQYQLAALLNINRSTLTNIIYGRSWI